MRYSDSSGGFPVDLYYFANKDQEVQIIRPFPSFKNSRSQNEAKCRTILAKMSFICVTSFN